MWSRNASPVAALTRPRPSITTFAVSCVSLLFRTTSAALFKSHLHRVRVRREPFQLGKAHGSLAKHLKVAAVEAQHAASLEESVDTQRRAKARGTRGRERVVGAGSIVTERHGRIGSHENRAGILDLRGQPGGIVGHDQQMLGRKVVGEMNSLLEVVGDDETAGGCADDLRAFESADKAQELLLDAVSEL